MWNALQDRWSDKGYNWNIRPKKCQLPLHRSRARPRSSIGMSLVSEITSPRPELKIIVPVGSIALLQLT